eukprot:4453802-Amphidinium_carterae.2
MTGQRLKEALGNCNQGYMPPSRCVICVVCSNCHWAGFAVRAVGIDDLCGTEGVVQWTPFVMTLPHLPHDLRC